MLTGIWWAVFDPVWNVCIWKVPCYLYRHRTIPCGNTASHLLCRFHLTTRPALPQEKLQQKNKAIRKKQPAIQNESQCSLPPDISLYTPPPPRSSLLSQKHIRLFTSSHTWHFQVITGVSHYRDSKSGLFSFSTGTCLKIKKHWITLWVLLRYFNSSLVDIWMAAVLVLLC